MSAERIVSLCPVAEPWHALVDGECRDVAAFALVSITDTIEDAAETWRTVAAVVPGTIDETVPLEGAHPVRLCSAQAAPAPTHAHESADVVDLPRRRAVG